MVVAHYGMCPSGTCEGVPKADAFKREPWLLLFANPRGSGRPSLDGRKPMTTRVAPNGYPGSFTVSLRRVAGSALIASWSNLWVWHQSTHPVSIPLWGKGGGSC